MLEETRTPVTAGTPGTAFSVDSDYDPLVEFLEIATRTPDVSGNGTVTAWKIYGPDLNGAYGGLQGIGGLEAAITLSGNQAYRVGVVGNVLGMPQGLVTLDGSGAGFAWLPLLGLLTRALQLRIHLAALDEVVGFLSERNPPALSQLIISSGHSPSNGSPGDMLVPCSP